MKLQFEEEFSGQARIRVAGVGGAGGNAVNGMVDSGLTGVDFMVINTDAQALQESAAPARIQIGTEVTRGLGSGGDPRVGAHAMEEDEQVVAEALAGSDMVFVTAGMGGGTGTGAAPAVARVARQLGSLVVGIVTLPFGFEGRKRGAQALEGLESLRDEVDTIIVIPNDRLLKVVPAGTPLLEAFRVADNVLYQATKGISDLITVPGLVNLDFADVRSIMREMGDAIMGTGVARGESRALEAAHAAISSPLLEDIDIRGAQGVLVNITGGQDMSLHEVSEVTSIVQEAVGADANMIFGAVINGEISDELRVTVIATGFGAAFTPKSETRSTAIPAVRPAPASRPTADPFAREARTNGGDAARPHEAEPRPDERREEVARPAEAAREARPEPNVEPRVEPAAEPKPVLRAREAEAGAERDRERREDSIRRLLDQPPSPSSLRFDGASSDEPTAADADDTSSTDRGSGRTPSRDELDLPSFLRKLRD